MKILIFILIIFISVTSNAQDEKAVTLVVSGQGKTQEEARKSALRSAIEQAFGAFISSKTEILNDKLIKDEIVSVANGNIQKFEILDEVLLPNITYASTLKATVSIGRLTTFCQSKGIKSEFKGGLFAMNIAMQELNEKNEKQGVDNLYQTFIDILPKCLDYNIIPSEPVNENNKWEVQLSINFILNKNFDVLTNYVLQFVKSISMSEADVNSYRSLNKPVYPIKINRDKSFEGLEQSELVIDTYYLRNQSTYNSIISFPYTILKYIITRMRYNNSIEIQDLFTYMKKYANLDNKCLVTIESKMQFFRYLDFYSEYSKKYMMDKSTSMFQNSAINPNGGRLMIADGSPKSICANYQSYDWVKNAKTGNEDRVFNGKLSTGLTSSNYYSDVFNANWFKEDLSSKVNVPGAPIFNIHGNSNKEFLKINFSEYFTIEEIKKITEYKVVIN